ncbi:MAG TPA: hypothetical protein DD473_10255 [Planctomycetaceae bacterium]|nr:hypothetical protein [Planctomycetaceae bacterium]
MATKKKRDSAPAQTAQRGSGDDVIALKTLGRYEIQKKLGSGGMGAVYLALDTNLKRMVAVKVLPLEKAENPTLVKRFKAEAQAAAQLTHDNIVRVFESGEADGLHYIAMEYVEGTDVQRLIKKRTRLPVRRATEIIKQVAMALEHASEASIVHRDIKPSNLLITQTGLVKLTDLGLARVMDDTEETSITRAGTTVGTVDYMSPEQARSSKAADIRSDLYSLGCTWYHMLTGSPPFPEGSVTNKLHAHATAPIPDPRSQNELVPEAIVGVLQRLMAKKPIDRYQTVAELLEDLEAVKSSKREVRSEDLAALAGEEDAADEENDEDSTGASSAPSRRRTSRVAREMDDEEDVIPARTGKSSNGAAPAPTNTKSQGSSVDALPPRERRKLEDVEGKSPSNFNLDILKYAILAIGVIAIFGLVGYGISQLGGAVDTASEEQVDLGKAAQELQAERLAEAERNAANPENQPNTNDPNSKSPKTNDPPPKRGAKAQSIVADKELTKDEIAQLPVVRIVDASTSENASSAHSIQDALGKTDEKDLVIEIATTKSFIWEQPASIENRNVILRAAEKSPGLIIVNSAGAMTNGLLQGRNAQVVIENLHFGLLGYDLPGQTELQLLSLLDTDLSVRNCSFTMEESRANSVQLCQFAASASQRHKLQWRNNLVRGTSWQPFQCAANRIDLQVEDSLFLIGGNPLLNLNLSFGGSRNGNVSSEDKEKTEREITLTDVLVLCHGTPINMANSGGRVSASPTQFRMNRAHFVATAGHGEAPFLNVANWPENVLSTGSSGQLSHVSWISEKSTFSGWTKRLVATTNKTRAVFNVSTEEDWQKFWGNSGLFGVWDEKSLPENSTVDFPFQSGRDLQTIGVTTVVRPSEDTLKDLANIPAPELPKKSWRAELAALESTPTPAADPFNDSVKRVSVNLNDPKIDLGKYLATTNLPNPVIIEAKGFGIRTSSPIQLLNRKIKIEFQSEAGKFPLTIRPEKVNGTPWITVQGGFVVIENGVFRVDPPSNQPMPSHWLIAENADVIVRNCYVTAPATKNDKLASLIATRRKGNVTAEAKTLLIDKTYLQYGGDVIAVDLRASRLFVDHSVLVSQNHLLMLNYSGTVQDNQPGFFSLSQTTCSSRQGDIHFDIPATENHRRPLVSGKITGCVFTKPVSLEGKDSPNTQLLSASFPLPELPKRVWWWEDRNGYTTAIQQELMKKPLPQIWSEFWGRGHVENPLFGPEGVMLESNSLVSKDLRPSSFALFKDCKASSWNATGKRIGADCEKLDLPEYEGETSGNNPNKNNPAKPGPNRVPQL